MSSFRLAGIIRESIVDGPGIRFVVFVQGCPHHCKDCHNPQTWPFEGGKLTDTGRVAEEIKKNPLLAGVTISGGEPFCQAEAMAEVARDVHDLGLNVITYTGYLYEQLFDKAKNDEGTLHLLEGTDILIDGPFVAEQRSYELHFRGSANQRAIDVNKSMAAGRVVEAQI